MANKFIVFVVYAAVVRASLATDPSVESAREASRCAWRQTADTVCKSTQNESWPLEDARDEYRMHQMDGAIAFRGVAPYADQPIVAIEAAAFSTACRDAIFRGIRAARQCGDFATIIATIEDLKEQLPYEGLVDRFHQMTDDTCSTDDAVAALRDVYAELFYLIENLAVSVAEGAAAVDCCSVEGVYEKVDVITDILYGWLE